MDSQDSVRSPPMPNPEEFEVPEQEEPYNANDPKMVNAARKKAARLHADKIEVIKALMGIPRSRKWMYDLLESCYIFGNPFVPGSPDSTAFNLGQANIGKRLLADIMEADPDKYVLMCKEANARK